jgi:hypothetical protein
MMAPDFTGWYKDTYPQLSGHGIWLRGREPHRIDVSEYSTRSYRMLFARLSTYRDTSASYTHRLLYQLAAANPVVFPDVAFLPPPEDGRLMAEENIPWLIGTATKIGPQGFDCIGLSNSIVQELINIPVMLDKSNIPLKKSERLLRDDIPLILLGGANAPASQFLFCEDPLVDGIFAGNNPADIKRLLTILSSAKKDKRTKMQTLALLQDVGGFFLPESTGEVVLPHNEPSGYPVDNAPLWYDTETAATGHLPVSEGCPWFCGFCFESHMHKPYREMPLADIKKTAMALKAAMGLEELELFSYNVNAHSEFTRMLSEISPLFLRVGIKSQRFDVLARNSQILPFLHAVGKTNLTCALEGISPRLRAYLQKGLTDEDLDKGFAALLGFPLRELKVFLIATGLETDEDYAAFDTLLRHWSARTLHAEKKPRIIFSMTPLVRFPLTPLADEDACSVHECKRIFAKTGGIVRKYGFEFRPAMDAEEYELSQMLLRATRSKIQKAIVAAILQSEFVYYRGVTPLLMQTMSNQLIEAGQEPAFWQKVSPALPRLKITGQISHEFIDSRKKQMESFSDNTETCMYKENESGPCAACGACAPALQSSIPNAVPESSASTLVSRLTMIRKATRTLHFLCDVHSDLRGVSRKLAGAHLASAIMKAMPELTPHYRRFGGSFLGRTIDAPWITGHDILALDWLEPAAQRLCSTLDVQKRIDSINRVAQPLCSALSINSASEPLETVLIFESPYPLNIHGYFELHHLQYTQINTGDATREFQFSKDSRRKNIIKSLSYEMNDLVTRVMVTPGEKFDSHEFHRTAFALPTEDDWVKVAVTARMVL